jgi:hypothetical protein
MCVCVCVCLYQIYTFKVALCTHSAAHIQHSVICNGFTVDVTIVWCLFDKLVILVCYFLATTVKQL